MGFKKGDAKTKAISAKGNATRRAKAQAWDNIVGWLIGDGGHRFKELIATLSVGGAISKEEKEFLAHYKDLLEFHQPKLSRAEQKTTHEGSVDQNISIEFVNGKSKTS